MTAAEFLADVIEVSAETPEDGGRVSFLCARNLLPGMSRAEQDNFLRELKQAGRIRWVATSLRDVGTDYDAAGIQWGEEFFSSFRIVEG